MLVTDIPTGLQVLHKCDIPPCVNPSHLTVGTQGDNMRQSSLRGRRHRKITRGDAERIRALLSDGKRDAQGATL